MKVKVKDIFNALQGADAERTARMAESVHKGGDGSFDGYGKLLLKRHDLGKLLGSCDLEIEIPKHMEELVA